MCEGTSGSGPVGGGPAGAFASDDDRSCRELDTLRVLDDGRLLGIGFRFADGARYGILRKSMSNARSLNPGTRISGIGDAGGSSYATPKLYIIISSVTAGDRCGCMKSPAPSSADFRC